MFPGIKAVERPLIPVQQIPSPYWLSGFVNGESCFFIPISETNKTNIGFVIQLKFFITQHSRDTLMNNIVEYLNCGRVQIRSKQLIIDFAVTKFNDINEKIIPFFEKYHFQGLKLFNYKKFCEAATIIKNKEHLTEQGYEKIRLIKMEMNKM